MAEPTAKPFQEGRKWAVRIRVKGYDRYLGGFKSERAAAAAALKYRQALDEVGKPARMGPERTTLAAALQDYGREVLPSHKGADQEARRINAYLRAAGLPVLKLTKVPRDPSSTCYWKVELEDESERRIVRSLQPHRNRAAARSQESSALRKRLSHMKVCDVMPYDVQQLVGALKDEGYAASTIALERALLRSFFNYAKDSWSWTQPPVNPAHKIKAPRVDNARERVLSNGEWAAIAEELARYDNPYALPVIRMLLATAMRISEPLTYARWHNVDWNRHLLHLDDSKTGGRSVPLPPEAEAILRELQAKSVNASPEDLIFPTTYEAVKKAWSTARAAAKVPNVHLHDLRHTAATRYALEFGGNIPVLKLITGHKSLVMLHRYINLRPEMVSYMMHDSPMPLVNAPAGYAGRRPSAWAQATGLLEVPEGAPQQATPKPKRETHGNVVQVAFGTRPAA